MKSLIKTLMFCAIISQSTFSNAVINSNILGGEVRQDTNLLAWAGTHVEPDLNVELLIMQKPRIGVAIVGNKFSWCDKTIWQTNEYVIVPDQVPEISKKSMYQLNILFTPQEWQALGQASNIRVHLCSRQIELTADEVNVFKWIQEQDRQYKDVAKTPIVPTTQRITDPVPAYWKFAPNGQTPNDTLNNLEIYMPVLPIKNDHSSYTPRQLH